MPPRETQFSQNHSQALTIAETPLNSPNPNFNHAFASLALLDADADHRCLALLH
jgi:hypothetical protein